MSTESDDRAKVSELVKAAKIAFVTTRNADGTLHSRPLAVQKTEFDGDLWFFTQDPSEKTADVAADDRVNAAFQSSDGFLSVAGTASVVHDSAKVDELWNTAVEAWFPNGKDDPSVALLRIEADSAEYWATDEPRAVTLFKIAKAAATHHQPDVGEDRTVEL